MGRGIMTEANKKALQDRLAENQRLRRKAYVVGKYRVYRFDEWNWCYQKTEDGATREPSYYPNLETTLSALLPVLIADKVLDNQRHAPDVKTLLAAIESARNDIINAVKEANL